MCYEEKGKEVISQKLHKQEVALIYSFFKNEYTLNCELTTRVGRSEIQFGEQPIIYYDICTNYDPNDSDPLSFKILVVQKNQVYIFTMLIVVLLDFQPEVSNSQIFIHNYRNLLSTQNS